MRHARVTKAAVVTAVATAVCHLTMSAGFAWARDRPSEHPDDWSGLYEFGATVLASWILMPLVLWAGMRVLGERRTHLQVYVGALLWGAVSWYHVDDIDRAGGVMPPLVAAVFVVVGALLGAFDPGPECDEAV
ncbi:hypothetical protein F0L17_01240 [Streptomyces sp. TRM43335]|uniref:Integral membrane protein n=1 Tax=Streptomyces taklimakanensis TaxID=2569853 RepID=A0A6G2B688_9ACTN|nr:hypothetical protein [Streptomyces taklimakanensis]MTE17778.1 hypothetical protein [Streptomyces taklimakanensis]